jgi:hypothetical protein
MTLLLLAAANAGPPTPQERPVCAAVIDALKVGEEEAKTLLSEVEGLAWPDMKCLKAAKVPDGVRAVGRDRLRAENPKTESSATPLFDALLDQAATNLDEVDNSPIEIYVLIMDPAAVAADKEGDLVAGFGVMASWVGVDVLEDGVYDGVAENAQAAFARDGVQVAITHAAYTVNEAKGWHSYGETSDPNYSLLQPGTYELLKIVVYDPVGVAQASEGFGKVMAGAALGMDIPAKVRTEVERNVWRTLDEEDIAAVIVR